MKKLLLLSLFASTSLSAQTIPSGAQQIQGTSAINRGNAVNVRITDGSGNAVTSEVPTGTAGSPATDVITVQGIAGGTAQPISAASLPLPSGASTSALQTTANTNLATINTTLGSPLQAGGSIGNTSFAATQATASSLNAQIVGNAASGTTTAGNPITIAGRYNATMPTFTDGQRGDIQIGSRGRTLIGLGLTFAGADAIDNTTLIYPAGNNAGESTGGPIIAAQVVYNGTSWDRQRGDTVATTVLPGISSTAWSYTSGASPILSNTTTAVTIKAAAGASVRNYLTSCQITTTAFATSVPLAIRDGAGGTVIWALTVPTAGFLQPVNVTFPMPLRGTANTLLEIVTTTANTSGTVTANCQGFTGA